MNETVDISNVLIKTNRLILRAWKLSDLGDFYEYASVDGVGQMAGWLPHKNKEESLVILNHFISGLNELAIVYQGKAIGSIGINEYNEEELPNLSKYKGVEIGFVLSKDYWGKGLMPEACQEVIKYLFENINLDFIVCGHFIWNNQSKRVQEKLGFKHYKLIKYKTRYNTIEDCWLSLLFNEKSEAYNEIKID